MSTYVVLGHALTATGLISEVLYAGHSIQVAMSNGVVFLNKPHQFESRLLLQTWEGGYCVTVHKRWTPD